MLRRFVAECVTITPGKGKFPAQFNIGAANPEKHEWPASSQQLSRAFRISKYEMTQELYEHISGNNPSRWKGPRNSVEQVTRADVIRFCAMLTRTLHMEKLIPENEHVRPPTAVEWEYCCRAGSDTAFCFGDDAGKDKDDTSVLDTFAWHTGNAAGNDPAVGVLLPNKWGLYDVHGYLWEFVTMDSEPDGKVQVRGGSWRDEHAYLSCSSYLLIEDSVKTDAIGFRCVIAEKPATKNRPDQ